MQVTYYQLIIENGLRNLNNLSHILDKAADYCKERNIDEKVLLGSRLFPDMYPLVKQVQIVSDITKGSAARLTGKEPPKMEDKETSFAELKQRLADTAAFLKTFKQDDFKDSATREIRLPWRPDEPISGETFLLHQALAHIAFHITTSYNILRHNGVALGKADYIGNAK